MLKSQLRADEYRGKAREAAALAEASVLQQVRERHASAARKWIELAVFEEQQVLNLGRRFDRAAQARLQGLMSSGRDELNAEQALAPST